MILIVTNKVDPHADAVIDFFHKKGIEFVRFNTEDFPQRVSLTWETRESVMDGEMFFPGGHRTRLSQIKSCWYRRPFPPTISKELISPQSKEFAGEESNAVLKELWTFLFHCFWVNYPITLRQAGSKINNLKVASGVGFFIPRTILTNDPEEATEFFRKCQGNVINKVVGSGQVEYQRDYYFVYTHRVSIEDLKNIKNVSYTPTLFQEYIPKKLEVRTTIVGKRVFSCEIHSQDSERARDDWRHYDFENVQHTVHHLPTSIEAMCLKMMGVLNLRFATFDLILTPNNHYVFLELNPNGQWLWIEQFTGLPISKAIAELLVSQGKE